MKSPVYALISDAPPLKQGGHGCHGLAWNWLQAMRHNVNCVVTHRLSPSLDLEAIKKDLAVPVVFYPDLARTRVIGRMPTVKSLLEFGLFLLALPRILHVIKQSRANRLFAFFGANFWFLLLADIVARRSKLPLDIYLVDDLEESERHAGRKFTARVACWLEGRILRNATRVFVISPGYTEHLRRKYNVHSHWLPVPVPAEKLSAVPYQPKKPDVREITFIGGVNFLYLDGLKDLLGAIAHWNATSSSYKLKLLVITYTSRKFVETELGAHPDLLILIRPPADEIRRHMNACWASFLPYSFSEDARVMVSTSFASKLVDSLLSGRPILVYGPAYASVPRYFLDRNVPLCATSREQLLPIVSSIAEFDGQRLNEAYNSLLREFHSADALRRRMALEEASEAAESPKVASR